MEANYKHNIAIGTVINDKYVILEFIAKGGMGEVYRAHQTVLKRDVAIKIISREWLKSLEDDEDEIEIGLQRFRNEVQTMAQIRHPNIVQIYDYGSFSFKKEHEHSLVEYISMEYVPGGTLRSTMSEDGFYPEEDLTRDWLRKYFLPVLEGAEALHSANMVHRDLKPGNVLMDGKIPKIADFGLARSSRFKPVTHSVDVKGTPPYMSPEHFYDLRRADRRADIYSLGKILFEAIDGKITSKMIPFKQARLPNPETIFFKGLDQIIQDATVEDRNMRLESVKRFRSALLETLDISKNRIVPNISSPHKRYSSFTHPKWIWSGIALAIFSVAAMTVWHLTGDTGGRREAYKSPQIILEGPSRGAVSGPPRIKSSSDDIPAQSIMGRDGLAMRLIPGGFLKSRRNRGEGQGNTTEVTPFYIDETKITIHHFVEFLNNKKDTLTIEKGLVKHDGVIWFLLGEGAEPQGQILYRHGLFHLRNPEYAAHPVVRVTWYGASAYAKHFGKRLPTEYEWELAAQIEHPDNPLFSDKKTSTPQSLEEEMSSRNMESTHMKHMSSDVDSNHGINNEIQDKTGTIKEMIQTGISELRDKGADIREWVVQIITDQGTGRLPAKDQESVGYSSLVIGKSILPGDSATQEVTRSFRYPWEGFFDVGFRCVADIPPKSDVL
jgi:serine/threonine-protein kinase